MRGREGGYRDARVECKLRGQRVYEAMTIETGNMMVIYSHVCRKEAWCDIMKA